MIKLEKVNKEINGNHIIKDIDIELVNNGLVFILGPSGSGKTTLLNLMGTLSEVTSGKIIYKEKEISKLSEEEKGKYRNQEIGFIFQEWNLIENISVKENIEISLILQGRKNEEKVEEVMKHLKIWELRDREIRGLSGGEKARVGIARALVKEPKMLLCDEPTGNLDYKTSEEVFKILKEISKEMLVIVVSHDEISANKYGSEIITLIDGVITNVEAKEYYSNFDAEAINEKKYQKLSLKNIFKLSFLFTTKHKLSYLFMGIILAIVTTFFSIGISFINIDENKTFIDAFKTNKIDDINFYKKGTNGNVPFTEKNSLDLYQNLQQKKMPYSLSANTFTTNDQNILTLDFYDISKPVISDSFYAITGIDIMVDTIFIHEVAEDYFSTYNFKGSLSTNKNEITISNFLAELIMYYGVYDIDGNIYQPKTYEEFFESQKKINFGGNYFKVTGIYEIKDINFKDIINKKLNYKKECSKEEEKVLCTDVLIEDDDIKKLKDELGVLYVHQGFFYKTDFAPNSTMEKQLFQDYIILEETINLNYTVITKRDLENRYHLRDNEIVVNQALLNIITKNDYKKRYEDEQAKNGLTFNGYDFTINYMKEKNILNSHLKYCIRDIEKFIGPEFNYFDVLIVDYVEDNNLQTAYISDNIIKNYVTPLNMYYRTNVIFKSENELINLLNEYEKNDNYGIESVFDNILKDNHLSISKIKEFAQKYIVLIIIFIYLLVSLFMYFIRRSNYFNIGLLKCLGTRKKDINYIFMIANIIFSSCVFSSTLFITPIILKYINLYLSTEFIYQINYLFFTQYNLLFFLLSFIILVMSTIVLPIKRINDLEPIEIIRGKNDKIRKSK